MDTPKELIDAGAWIGRQQAFAVIGSKCLAAQALSLKQTKESRAHEMLGLTWEEFCSQYAGISRAHADGLIRQLDEFGDTYFRLSEIARISPETYRQIAPHIDGDTIEIEGEKLALSPENAPKIRSAILQLRAQLRQAREQNPARGVVELQSRLDALLSDTDRIFNGLHADDEISGFQALCKYAASKWTKLGQDLEFRRLPSC